MKKDIFGNAKNITSSFETDYQNKKLRRSDHISSENINQRRYESNSSFNKLISIQNQRQNNYNLLQERQDNINKPYKENKGIIINKRINQIQDIDIDNNVYNNLYRKEYYDINNNVNNHLNNNINNSINNNLNNRLNYYVNNKIINNKHNKQLDMKNEVNNNEIRKKEKNLNNHSFYSSKYSNKNKKIYDISDSESSKSNRTFISEPSKKTWNELNRQKEEGDVKNLVNKMTELINTIQNERRESRIHTIALNDQTKALNAQTKALKLQTIELKAQTLEMRNQYNEEKRESRNQHRELMKLMSQTVTDLSLNVRKLVNKFVDK